MVEHLWKKNSGLRLGPLCDPPKRDYPPERSGHQPRGDATPVRRNAEHAEGDLSGDRVGEAEVSVY